MRCLLFIFMLSFLLSCTGKSPYQGFSVSDDGIHYRLHKIGDDSVIVQPGNYVMCDITYSTASDSVFFKGRRKFQVNRTIHDKTGFDKCLTMMHLRDSTSFMQNIDKFFGNTLGAEVPTFLRNEEVLKISVELLEVQSEDDFNREKKIFLSWIEDFNTYEKEILKQYLNQEHIDVEPTTSGLYYLPVKQGNGRKIAKGDTVIVHYEGMFLNGDFFDSTRKRSEPFGFVYGQEWQVIEGLEEAIGMMTEGEKALFILPSDIAWGQAGSSTGIIPPYTSLIFEVEVIELIKATDND